MKSVLTGEIYQLESNWWVNAYGTVSVFNDNKMVLVDKQFAERYPSVLPSFLARS